jgi:hypothetical protein
MTTKPPYGQACNGCGQCCKNELCPLGNAVFKRWEGPCPALEREGERFGCGLVKHPERWMPVRTFTVGKKIMSEAAAYLIGAGRGCDAQLEGEVDDPAFRARERRKANLPFATKCLSMWGFSLRPLL